MRYASRAKFIKNKPTINEDPKDALLKEYAEEIRRLKEMLQNGGMMPSGGQLQGLNPNFLTSMTQAIMDDANNQEKENLEGMLKNKDEELKRHQQ